MHFDKIYNHEKFAYYQRNLEYEVVTDDDKSLIPREYVFTINSNAKTLIHDIRDFTTKLQNFIRKNSSEGDIIYAEYTQFKYEQFGYESQKYLISLLYIYIYLSL